MTKRKMCAMLLIGVMVMVSGCSGADSSNSADSESANSTGTSTASGSSQEENSTSAGGESAGSSEKLTIAYFNPSMGSVWIQNVAEALEELGQRPEYNFEVLVNDCDSDPATQQSQVTTAIANNIDGAVVMVADEASGEVFAQQFAEAGIPVIGESLDMLNSDGTYAAPCVILDAYNCGYQAGEWLVENAESYGIDLSDLSKVGLVRATETTQQSDVRRSDGFTDAVLEVLDFPEANIFTTSVNADPTTKDQAQSTYNQLSSILGANPQIEYWLCCATVDDYGIGAVRAFEDAGVSDNTVMTSIGGERAIPEWQNGASPCWKACVYYTAMDCAEIVVEGLVDMMRNGTDATEIFEGNVAEGETYPVETFSGRVITSENYTEYVTE